jgi:Arc/MetJ-type ribon-helix-helix transcriptional regulator
MHLSFSSIRHVFYGKNEIDLVRLWLGEEPVLSEVRIVSVKIPEEVYQEMALRIPEGDRSTFIREAISEKLQKTPKADKLLALQERMGKIEQEFGQIKKSLADLEILTFQHGKINPHSFCIDELDHKIMEYLLHYKSATTPELADYIKTNRWLILNRLRKIQKTSKKQVGKSIIEYCAGERSGKKKAWWIDEELIQE